jgi:hypothetical protein
MRFSSLCWLSLVTVPLVLAADQDSPTEQVPPGPARKIEFTKDIEPILVRSCQSCHGPKKQRGGLRLDNAEEALLGGNSGPVLAPGAALKSKLLRVVAGLDPDLKMPPEGNKPLTAQEVGLLRAWIDQGARWPRQDQVVARRTSDHWAFQPIRRPIPPALHSPEWVRNPLDAFVLARLEKEGYQPSPPADRATLIRRLSLDLLGLLPDPQQVDTFLADTSPDAYERLVDRLLASPAYGERWGRHWLDLARYADSDGYEKDRGRPHAWRWRQWVIDAFNRDLPYDQFTIEQLAGDLLPHATLSQKIATGFHRNTLTNTEGGVDQEQFRVEAVADRVNTTGQVFLGLTLGCARCHDHKYDPISQKDYYRFFAFFNSDREVNLPLPASGPQPAKKGQRPMARTLALGPTRPTHVLIRGDFLRKGAAVEPDTPEVFPPLPDVKAPRRDDLARWIVADNNPLTSRVLANWLWHKFFGRGLVATLEDFGTRGEKPSHPELLDWLATEVRRQNWSLKAMHRLIVTSATYRQSSAIRPELQTRDPLNVLLARQSRQRLEAEVIRDVSLSASGLLAPRIGGPSVRPPQPKGISSLTYANSARWVESKGADRYRRGLYTWFQRTSPYPMLMTFDAPDANVCCVRRQHSNTPLQALTSLNDPVFVECAQGLAERILREELTSPEGRLRRMFRLCLVREPGEQELARLARLREEFLVLCKKQPAGEATRLAGRAQHACPDVYEAAVLVAIARTLMNLDEFLTRE